MSSKVAYIQFCAAHDEVPLFHQPFWWDAVLHDWDVKIFEHENAIAYLPFASYKKWGFSFSRNPFLTPYSGLLFGSSEYSNTQKQGLFDLAKEFLSQFSISQYDCHPLLSHGITTGSTKQTYLLTLDQTEDELFKGLKSSQQRQVRKATKQLSIQEENSIDALYKFYTVSLDRQKGKDIVPPELAQKVFELCNEKKCGQIFSAQDEKKNLHAAIWYVEDKNCGYYLLGGSNPDFLGSGAMSALLWHCIKKALANGKAYFDFEGSEVPGVARFFATFGGKRLTFPLLSAPTSPKLKALLKVKGYLGQ